MAFTRARSFLRRLSVLDLLTIVVLAIATFLFVRPGSTAHASATRWLARRDMESAVQHNWNQIISLAAPLYSGAHEPEVVEFSDYECPFCRSASPAVDSAVASGVRVALIHLPLRIHPNARPAAIAAICAQRIGRFRDAHRFFMTTSAWRTDTAWSTMTGFSDLARVPGFTRCLTDPAAQSQLEKQIALAESLRVSGTPKFVSRQGVLSGAPTALGLTMLVRRR